MDIFDVGVEDEDELVFRQQEFADPGGKSALRAGVRNHPCPTCGEENMLTSKDVSLGYQCDNCADILEGA